MEAAADDPATLDRVVGRSSVDYLLRNAHQQLVQLSAQADLKASIMLTTSAVALSFAFSRGHSSDTRPSLIILELGIFAALVCAILVALPSLPMLPPGGGRCCSHRARAAHRGVTCVSWLRQNAGSCGAVRPRRQ